MAPARHRENASPGEPLIDGANDPCMVMNGRRAARANAASRATQTPLQRLAS